MKFFPTLLLLVSLLVPDAFSGVREDLGRAEKFGREASSLLLLNEVRTFWSDGSAKLVYRVNTERDGHRFFQVNLASGAKAPAFDHEALAKALAVAAKQQVNARALPLEAVELTAELGVVRFRAFGSGWRFDAAKSLVSPDNVPPKPAPLLSPEETMHAARHYGGPTSLTIENGTDGEIEMFWVQGRGERKS